MPQATVAKCIFCTALLKINKVISYFSCKLFHFYMAKIKPVTITAFSLLQSRHLNDHVKKYDARITNMKAMLVHSLPGFEVYMQWYSLYEEIKKLLGERLAYLCAWPISVASNCLSLSVLPTSIAATAGSMVGMDQPGNGEHLQWRE